MEVAVREQDGGEERWDERRGGFKGWFELGGAAVVGPGDHPGFFGV
jgi:hypothetical protein